MASTSKGSWFGAFVIGWLVLVVAFIGVYTQFILNELTAMGIAVPFEVRLNTTWQNLASLMFVVLAIILGLGFSIAMGVAALIGRAIPILPTWIHALAGFAAVYVVLEVFQLFFGGINLLPAARSTMGFFALCLVGALAGYVYRSIVERRRMASLA